MKKGYRRQTKFEKKNIRFRSGHGSTRRVNQVVAPAGLLTNPDRSNHQVDRVPGRPAGPVWV